MLSGRAIEGAVRRVVAQRLGVARDLLDPGVSLRDDLGTTDATVHELVLAVEHRVGVRLEEGALDAVRSYGELVEATVQAVRTARARLAVAAAEPLAAQVRIAGDGHRVERSGRLTGYFVESIADDVRRAGPGCEVTIAIQGRATDEEIQAVRGRLTGLERHGAAVRVVRGPEPRLKTGS